MCFMHKVLLWIAVSQAYLTMQYSFTRPKIPIGVCCIAAYSCCIDGNVLIRGINIYGIPSLEFEKVDNYLPYISYSIQHNIDSILFQSNL